MKRNLKPNANVILEEIAKYEDQPPFGAFERAMEVFFSRREGWADACWERPTRSRR